MTTTAENELLTRVGPGTPMGALMRQYWLPACLSTELTADGDPPVSYTHLTLPTKRIV